MQDSGESEERCSNECSIFVFQPVGKAKPERTKIWNARFVLFRNGRNFYATTQLLRIPPTTASHCSSFILVLSADVAEKHTFSRTNRSIYEMTETHLRAARYFEMKLQLHRERKLLSIFSCVYANMVMTKALIDIFVNIYIYDLDYLGVMFIELEIVNNNIFCNI